MNIAFCTTGNTTESPLDQRFGRASYFTILNDVTSEYKSVENTAKDEPGGAGTKAIQVLVDNNVDIVIAPEVGPTAFDAMKQMGIKGYLQGTALTIEEALEGYKSSSLKEVTEPGNKGLHRA